MTNTYPAEITVKALTSRHHQVFCSEHGQVGALYPTDGEARRMMQQHNRDAHTPQRFRRGDRVEITRQDGTVQQGTVSSVDYLSDGYSIDGYQVSVPESGESVIITASRVRAVVFTPGQRVTRIADNANGTVREITPDGVIVDMDHGTDVLGAPTAFRPLDDSPITPAEREAALNSWPAALPADDPFAKLPEGMERLVQIRWTVPGVVAGTEFVHRLFVSGEDDARRQIRRDFLRPGVPSSWITFLEVTGL